MDPLNYSGAIKSFLGFSPGELTRTDISAGSKKDGEFTSGTRVGQWNKEVEDIPKKEAQMMDCYS